MMTTSRGWSSFFGSAALLAFSGAASGIPYVVTPPTIRPGEHAIVEVRLPTDALKDQPTETNGEEESAQVQDDLFTQSTKFQLLSRDYGRERSAMVWRYEITAYMPGKIVLPPIEIRIGPQTFSTESADVVVSSDRADADESLRPEFGPVRPPRPWAKAMGYLFALLVTLTAGFFLRRYLQRRFRRMPAALPVEVAPAAPVETDLEWLRKRLTEIKARLDADGENPDLLDETTLTLKTYFARVAQAPVDAWTTRELLGRLDRVPAAKEFSPVFERCDAYKFSARAAEASPLPLTLVCLEESERILLCGN